MTPACPFRGQVYVPGLTPIRENLMSMIQAARKFAEMKEAGLSIDQISEKTGVDRGAIRDRLQLLTLTPEEQDQVKNNKLSCAQALRLCEQRQRASAKSKPREDLPAPAYESD